MKQYLPPALQRKLWGLLIQAEENRSLPPARATWQVEVKTIRRLGTNHVGLDRVVPRRGEAVEWIPYVTLFSAATATAISAALSRRGIPVRRWTTWSGWRRMCAALATKRSNTPNVGGRRRS